MAGQESSGLEDGASSQGTDSNRWQKRSEEEIVAGRDDNLVACKSISVKFLNQVSTHDVVSFIVEPFQERG